MNELEQAKMILTQMGAVITDSHVVYPSGKHGSTYIEKDLLYPYPWKTARLCGIIADHFCDDNVRVVIAPSADGIALSQWTAHFLSLPIGAPEILAVHADEVEGDLIISRVYERFIRDKRVLVVDHSLTTDSVVKDTVKAARTAGGIVVGVGVLCNCCGEAALDLASVPKILAVVNTPFDSWSEADCPLCKQGMPINTDVGKGREFLDAKMLYQA